MRKLVFCTGAVIDLDKVLAVEPTGGDKDFKRYTVKFVGGVDIEVYEDRRDMSYCMPRQSFLDAWATFLHPAPPPMKNFLVFAFNADKRFGGWDDFQFSCETIEEVRQKIKYSKSKEVYVLGDFDDEFERFQVVDLSAESSLDTSRWFSNYID